jgi:spermidine synthase
LHTPPEIPPLQRGQLAFLLFSVLLIAVCGLIYELLLSSVSTYFLGSGILHFSVTIGLFMSAMGLGAYLSRYVRTQLLERFILIELVLGLAGGLSTLLLYVGYTFTTEYYLVAFAITVLLGACIGAEIPLLTRIANQQSTLRDTVARVLAFDYLGALVASLLFPLVLLPQLGTLRTAFAVGLLNVAVGLLALVVFRRRVQQRLLLSTLGMGAIVLLTVGFVLSYQLVDYFERSLYDDEVLIAEQTPYQRIVLTKDRDDLRLYLNGQLQFCTRDEHRYHEPLVHLPVLLAPQASRVLILGGGDGLAARELLAHWDSTVRRITLVDLDPRVTELARRNPLLRNLNRESLNDPRVQVINRDAYKFIETDTGLYDVVIVDLPDPNDHGLGKLYSREFYTLLHRRLVPGGMFITQATSPYYAPKAFWCILHTVQAVFGEATAPCFTVVPTFGGVWGFVLAQRRVPDVPPTQNSQVSPPGAWQPAAERWQQRIVQQLRLHPVPFRYLSVESVPKTWQPDLDFAEVPTEVNTLDAHPLVQYYEESWVRWN